MKIEKLEFENINSLRGRFSIDFTHPELAGDGMFAITGPTGAGKTTLLDAISFALYGKTARLTDAKRKAKKSTKNDGKDEHNCDVGPDNDELMSSNAQSCMARVTFSNNGKRYAVSTSHRRANRRSENGREFGNCERIFEVFGENGSVTTAAKGISTVLPMVEQATNLTFSNFKRCMMLAQGDFASFLKANGTERGAILTTITGTGIYERIGQTVHSRYLDAMNAVNSRHPSPTLAQDERKEAEAKRDSLRQRKETLSKEERKVAEAMDWLQDIADAVKQVDCLQQRLTKARHASDDFARNGDEQHLQAATRAAKVQQAEAERDHAEDTLAATGKNREDVEGRLKELSPLLDEAQRKVEAAKHAHGKEIPRIAGIMERIEKELRPLEKSVALAEQSAESAKGESTKAASRYEQAQAEYQAAVNAFQAVQSELDEASRLLKEAEPDRVLVETLPIISLCLDKWAGVDKTGEAVPATEGLVSRLDERRRERESLLDGKREDQLSSLLHSWWYLAEHREYFAQFEEKRAGMVAAIAELEGMELPPLAEAEEKVGKCREIVDATRKVADMSEKLEELYRDFAGGILPCCPCCGSTTRGEHRSQTNGALAAAQKELDAAKAELKDCKDRHQRRQKKLDELRTALASGDEQHREQEQERQRHLALLGLDNMPENPQEQARKLERDITRISSLGEAITRDEALVNIAAMRDDLHHALNACTRELPNTLGAATGLVKRLRQRKKALQAAEKAVQEKERQLAEHRAAVAGKATEVEKAKAEAAAKDQRAAEAEKALTALAEKKRETWGEESANRRVRELNDEKDALIQALRDAEKGEALLLQEQQGSKTLLEELQRREDQQRQELAVARNAFAAALQTAGFPDAETYAAAKAWIPFRDELDSKRQGIRQELNTAMELHSQSLDNLKGLRDKNLCTGTAEELTARREELAANLEAAEKELVNALTVLETDNKAIKANEELKHELEPLMQERDRLFLLDDILGGGADTFKQYAQQITLERLLVRANKCLANITDRYELRQAPDLGIDVIDFWLDSEHSRPISTLSGGECFIVSLGLALGLAQMAGSETSLDTLFLDEGFGTLDREQLENVLHALENLRKDGKLIGIITHVDALAQRMPQQIVIEPIGNSGDSTITPREGVTAEPA